MLAISAAIIYKCTIISNGAKFMFPNVDCEQVAQSWAKQQAKDTTPNIWQ